MLFRFIAFLIFNILLTSTALSTIVECQILTNRNTGQIIIIYRDDYRANEIEKQQNGLITKQIKKVVKNNIETAILYEGPTLQYCLGKKQFSGMNDNPLWMLKEYCEELEYDKWNSAVKLVNIDNREHIYDHDGYLLKIFYRFNKNGSCGREILEHQEFSGLRYLDKCELDQIFFENYLSDFEKLKIAVNKSKDELDSSTKKFFKNKIDNLESAIRLDRMYLSTTKMRDYLAMNSVSHCYFLKQLYDYSVELQDLNTILYILSHPDVNKFIIFVGASQAERVPNWLAEDFCYEKSYHKKLDGVFDANSIIEDKDSELCHNASKAIPKDEYDKFNKSFDFIANQQDFYGNKYQMYTQKEFCKLMKKVRQKIYSDEQLSQGHIYRLEDMFEMMGAEKFENINLDMLQSYKKMFGKINKDFAQEYYPPKQISSQPSPFLQEELLAYRMCFSYRSLNANNNLAQINQG